VLKRALVFICQNGAFRKWPITENLDLESTTRLFVLSHQVPKENGRYLPTPHARAQQSSLLGSPKWSRLRQSHLTPRPPPHPADDTKRGNTLVVGSQSDVQRPTIGKSGNLLSILRPRFKDWSPLTYSLLHWPGRLRNPSALRALACGKLRPSDIFSMNIGTDCHRPSPGLFVPTSPTPQTSPSSTAHDPQRRTTYDVSPISLAYSFALSQIVCR